MIVLTIHDDGNNVLKSKPSVLANFVLFQIGWFACVLSAVRGMPLAGSGVAMAVVIWHIWCATKPVDALKLVLFAAALGTVWDSALVMTGWVRFDNGNFVPGIAPYWIIVLWALFATTLNVSLAWLRGRWILLALFGAIGGPLSYWSGARMGAMTIVDPVPITVALAIGWALMMVLLMFAAKRFNGFAIAEIGQP